MDESLIVAEIAEQIRSLYVSEMRRRSTHKNYNPGPRFRSIWNQAARLCLDHELNPNSHVRALLESTRNPYPNMLVGLKALRRTEEYMRREDGYAENTLNACVARLQSWLNCGYDLIDIIQRPQEPFPASFRYVTALRAGLTPIADQYRDQAMIELRTRPAFRRALSKLLPSAVTEAFDE